MRINRPLIHSYHVVRLRDIKYMRSCVSISRKHFFVEYSKMLALLPDSYEMSLFLADKASCTLLGYCAYNKLFYPLKNFDPDLKFIPVPKSSRDNV